MLTRNHSHRASGFTLIEVLLVLVILVILGSFAVTFFTGTRERASVDQAKAQISLVESATRFYQLHMNQYPRTLDDLVTGPSASGDQGTWGGPYLEKRLPLDPWNNEYRYVAPGKRNAQKYDVWSLGPDGQDGTADDIGNWQ